MNNDNPADTSLAQQRALAIYNEWRQSLTYEKQTYGSISKSIEGAVARCKKEIMHPIIRLMVIRNFETMVVRLSEFTPADEVDIEDIQIADTCSDASLETNQRCAVCGRIIATYEEKYPHQSMTIRGPVETVKCVDCHIK